MYMDWRVLISMQIFRDLFLALGKTSRTTTIAIRRRVEIARIFFFLTPTDARPDVYECSAFYFKRGANYFSPRDPLLDRVAK